jgi:hypothetical protein
MLGALSVRDVLMMPMWGASAHRQKWAERTKLQLGRVRRVVQMMRGVQQVRMSDD